MKVFFSTDITETALVFVTIWRILDPDVFIYFAPFNRRITKNTLYGSQMPLSIVFISEKVIDSRFEKLKCDFWIDFFSSVDKIRSPSVAVLLLLIMQSLKNIKI